MNDTERALFNQHQYKDAQLFFLCGTVAFFEIIGFMALLILWLNQ